MKLFKNGLLYDGTGSPAIKSDVLVEGDRILKVASDIQPEEGWEVIDIEGLSISSGFIDAHSHNDWFAVKKHTRKYFEPFIRQGITSFVTGNCGLSAVGFGANRQIWKDDFKSLDLYHLKSLYYEKVSSYYLLWYALSFFSFCAG